jgi:SAM-dependent methyltransferase
MLKFLAHRNQQSPLPPVTLPQGDGDVNDIAYRIRGEGPPLLLLPLSVAPSQWEPIMPQLCAHYCTITLSGAAVGMVASLEARGHTPGYLRVVGNLLDAAGIQPGEVILEVGCGTGVLDRWMVRRSAGANRVVAVDVNRFLLQEATALARKENVEHLIEFREGSAEALPFPDNHFDVTMSSTVIQRVDADRMLAEMTRVTRPGGRVAVVSHAHDVAQWVNLPDASRPAPHPQPGRNSGLAGSTGPGRGDRDVFCCYALSLCCWYEKSLDIDVHTPSLRERRPRLSARAIRLVAPVRYAAPANRPQRH